MNRASTQALTLVEVVVTILIVIVLCVIVLMVMPKPRERNRNFCMSNLKQIGLATHLYSSDWNEAFPIAAGRLGNANESLYLLLPNYMTSTKPFVCPFDSQCRTPAKDFTRACFIAPNVNSYAYVAGLKETDHTDSPLAGDNLKDATRTSDLAYQQFRDRAACTQGGGDHDAKSYYGLGGNIVYVDGHAQFNNGSKLKTRWLDNTNSTKNVKNPLGIKDGS